MHAYDVIICMEEEELLDLRTLNAVYKFFQTLMVLLHVLISHKNKKLTKDYVFLLLSNN